MNLQTKIGVAIDIIDTLIVKLIQSGESPNCEAISNLKLEKMEIYNFNEAMIEKAIFEYGKIIKEGKV